ncbi:MAG: DUF1080 domain-containing protein [Bryobacteraceae bacterium]
MNWRLPFKTLPLSCFALVTLSSLCAGSGFDGCWDITVPKEPHGRAWWLKIEGADTGKPSGDFISAFDGNLNPIEEIQISGDHLVFGFRPKSRFAGGENGTRHLIYTAKLSDGKLHGTYQVEGQVAPALEWTGTRAPVIRDVDDGSWHDGNTVKLFDEKSLAGWHLQEPDQGAGWSVQNGVLKSTGKVSNLVSDRRFWNFKLHLEFKVPEGSNSGVGLRARYEVQIKGDHGSAPDTHSTGALYSRIVPSKDASKPNREWQAFDIRLIGRQVTIVENDIPIIEKATIEGLTAMATDPNEAEPGPISLQGDHGTVEFRNITVTPLVH